MEIHEFKQLKLAFDGANEYEYAMKHIELRDFYFGRGKYYQLNYDSKFEHHSSKSYLQIEEYAARIGRENFIPLFIQDIESLSTADLTIKEVFYIFYFLYMMSKFVHENQLENKIYLPQEVVDLLKDKVAEYDQLYGDHIKEGERYDDIADIRAWPPELVNTCKKRMIWMHERYGYSQFIN